MHFSMCLWAPLFSKFALELVDSLGSEPSPRLNIYCSRNAQHHLMPRQGYPSQADVAILDLGESNRL